MASEKLTLCSRPLRISPSTKGRYIAAPFTAADHAPRPPAQLLRWLLTLADGVKVYMGNSSLAGHVDKVLPDGTVSISLDDNLAVDRLLIDLDHGMRLALEIGYDPRGDFNEILIEGLIVLAPDTVPRPLLAA